MQQFARDAEHGRDDLEEDERDRRTTPASHRGRLRRPLRSAEECQRDEERRQSRRVALRAELGGAINLGIWVMGAARLGDTLREGTLPGDLFALRACGAARRRQATVEGMLPAQQPTEPKWRTLLAEEQRLLTRLANDYPRLVSQVALVRGREARRDVTRFLRDTNPDERCRGVRIEMLPRLRHWAVRLAWADAQAGPQTFRLTPRGRLLRRDPFTLPFHEFAQWFHQRSMHHVALLLLALARRWRGVAHLLSEPKRGVDRELRLVETLTRGPRWLKNAAVMLGRAEKTLKNRRALWSRGQRALRNRDRFGKARSLGRSPT